MELLNKIIIFEGIREIILNYIKDMDTKFLYESPQLEIVELGFQGVLCESTGSSSSEGFGSELPAGTWQ